MAYAAVTPRSALNPWSFWTYAGLKSLAVAAAFGGLAGLIWYSYLEGARHGGRRAVPVIRAAATPIKTRPAEPGGVKVPDKDKRVYERIAPEHKKKLANNVERLIPRPAPVAITPKEAPKSAKTGGPPAAKSVVEAPRIKGGPARVRVGIEPKRTAAKRGVAEKPVSTKVRTGPSASLASAAFRVQIAAYPSPQMAARRWERLVGKHKDLVGKFEWFVERVDRSNGRGPLYRLQLGPLENVKAAKDLCAKLSQRKVSCFFVRG